MLKCKIIIMSNPDKEQVKHKVEPDDSTLNQELADPTNYGFNPLIDDETGTIHTTSLDPEITAQ